MIHKYKKIFQESDIITRRNVEEVLNTLEASKIRVANWLLGTDEIAAVESSMKTVYRQVRIGLKEAFKNLSSQSFHEWRKTVKRHMYYICLFEGADSKRLKATRKSLNKLSEHLGEDHDLSCISEVINNHSDIEVNGGLNRKLLSKIIVRRQNKLRKSAHRIGKRCFAEKPGRRFSTYHKRWKIWIQRPTQGNIIHLLEKVS